MMEIFKKTMQFLSGKTMKAYINKGYYKVNLHVNGVKEVVLLHRMLGFADLRRLCIFGSIDPG